MLGYLIDVENDRADTVDIGDSDHLKQLYRLIGCDCIDIIIREVGGKPYNIVLDDEGLLVDSPTFSAVDGQMRAALAGNLVIFGVGPDMDLAELEDADVESLRDSTYEVIDIENMNMHPVIVLSF